MHASPTNGLREHEPSAAMLCVTGATRPFIAEAWERAEGHIVARGRWWTPTGDGPLAWRSWPASMVTIRELPVAA